MLNLLNYKDFKNSDEKITEEAFWNALKKSLRLNLTKNNMLYYNPIIEKEEINKSLNKKLDNYKSVGNLSHSFIRLNRELFHGL